MGLISKIFGSHNDREVKRLRKTADLIESYADKYAAFSDEELSGQTALFKERYKNGESLDNILPEAFAVCREASARTLGMRHFYVQLLGGIALHQGRIAEMRTGEGKTLVATLPAYLNALTGKGMHIVTVNDYLAKRDAEWMGKVYKFLGMTVGVIVHDMTVQDKKAAYASDIVYATNNELGFDYLRDNMATNKNMQMQRELQFAIIDEVDSILIDEARTPLIISGRGDKSSELYSVANRFAKTLKADYKSVENGEEIIISDYVVEEKERAVRLSEAGVDKAEKFFKINNLSDVENQELVHYINNALRAHKMMFRDKQYMVDGGEVIIIDENTGRAMQGRRYSDGLHQAIEAKENVKVKSESVTMATITFQNFFRLYKKLSGMTGTAKTEENEFKGIYHLDVLELPTNMPVQRQDENDQLYTTRAGKLKATIADIEECYKKGQPVLVGTVTVDKSEELSRQLVRRSIRHQVLNAKNHQKEAEIVAQAGKKGAVTIATNMAGRGTDIMLGGNPDYMAQEKLRNLGYPEEVITAATGYAKLTDENAVKAREEYRKYLALFKCDTDKEKNEVIALGGLRIIGTERHDSRRIDNQLRGRAGRQGDPGSSVFYLSMEDDLLRVFGGDTMKAIALRLHMDEDDAIDNRIITRQIEKAQLRIEDKNFSSRKYVLNYDNVMNVQRNIIYKERQRVLDGLDIHDRILKMMEQVIGDIVNKHLNTADYNTDDEIEQFNTALEMRVLLSGTGLITRELIDNGSFQSICDAIYETAESQYESKYKESKELGVDMGELERAVMLRAVDQKWMAHIDAMDKLKQSISLLAYGQKDPITAYKNEGYDMFEKMNESIKQDAVVTLMKVTIKKKEEKPKILTVVKGKKVGRNEPCPCGSGKKYKHCCGNE